MPKKKKIIAKYDVGSKVKMGETIGIITKHNVTNEIHIKWANGRESRYTEYFLDAWAKEVQ